MKRDTTAYWVLFGCLVCQMGLGFSYVFSTFLKPITEDMGWSRTAFSAVGGPLLFSMALASPLIGNLTDRIGPRRVLTASTLLLGVVLAGYGFMETLWHYYALSLFLGMALTGLGDIPVGAVATRWFSDGRGRALGVIYVGSNVGGSIIPIVATAIALDASWRVALWALGGAAVLLILPFALFVVRFPNAPAIEEAAEADTADSAPSLDLRAALRTRSFWILGAALFTFYFYYLGVLNHLVAFLSDSGFSDPRAALHLSVAIGVGVAGKLVMGAVADRIPMKTALLANFALVTLASFCLLAADLQGMLLAFILIHGFAVAAENVVLPLIVVEAFGVRHMAQIYGMLMFALLPGGVLGQVFAGHMYDTLGSYDVAFTTFAVLNALTLVALFFVRRETRG